MGSRLEVEGSPGSRGRVRVQERPPCNDDTPLETILDTHFANGTLAVLFTFANAKKEFKIQNIFFY